MLMKIQNVAEIDTIWFSSKSEKFPDIPAFSYFSFETSVI